MRNSFNYPLIFIKITETRHTFSKLEQLESKCKIFSISVHHCVQTMRVQIILQSDIFYTIANENSIFHIKSARRNSKFRHRGEEIEETSTLKSLFVLSRYLDRLRRYNNSKFL